jgi:hypothetical protein
MIVLSAPAEPGADRVHSVYDFAIKVVTMSRIQRGLFVLSLLLLSSTTPGCIAFYGYEPVQVSVRDVETGEPIGGAKIRVWYRYMLVLNAPDPTEAKTDPAGAATLQVATFAMQSLETSAEGYMNAPEQDSFEVPKDRVVFDLYRKPRPRITIIVPNNYRGPLKIDRRPSPTLIKSNCGTRDFTFKATADGYVRIETIPRLKDDFLSDNIHVVDEEGHDIVRRNDPNDVGLNWVTCSGDGGRDLFVIGTKMEVEAFEDDIYDGDRKKSVSLNHKAFDALFDGPH